MQVLGTLNKFDQCVLNIALINICDSESYFSQQLKSASETEGNLWRNLQQINIYLPHPEQQYEGLTLEEGLTRGYNIEVESVKNLDQIFYQIPQGGHFVVVFKQKRINTQFEILATGIFIRQLGILSLDVIIDPDQNEYQSLVVKHPIIRDYPADWETKLKLFLQREIPQEELPSIVKYVDRAYNQDYRSPSWNEVYLSAMGFSGV